MKGLLHLIVFIILYVENVLSEPILHTTLGKINGFEYETTSGANTEVFLNIPFAKPPIGELRFEKPQPAESWEGIRNGTTFGPACLPHSKAAILTFLGEPSEDCLTLNVIKPKKKAPAGGYPVLVWIHGGGYEIGSASLYGYKGFANIYVSNDIVVISVQYRLAVYGFLALSDDDLPGNLGLWDLSLALKFIHDNSDMIGLDTSRIVLWGLSAGGSAVQQLTISPHSSDYISGSIEMSGSAWAHWALGSNVQKHSQQLAKQLGCENDQKSCLKSKSTEEIFDAVEKIGRTTDGLDILKFAPRIDGHFIPSHPNILVNKINPKPAIIGVSNKDASFFTILGLSKTLHNLDIPKNEFNTFGKEQLEKKIKYLVGSLYADVTDEAVQDLIDYYAPEGGDVHNGFYLDKYSQMMNDIMFLVPAVEGAVAKRNSGSIVFAYSFDHYNEAIWNDQYPPLVKGSVHVNEYPYMFELFVLAKFEYDEKETIVKEVLQESFISFVKNLKPSHRHGDWNCVGKEEDLQYLSITHQPQMKHGYFNQSVSFHRNMTKKFGFDLTSFDRKTTQPKEEL